MNKFGQSQVNQRLESLLGSPCNLALPFEVEHINHFVSAPTMSYFLLGL